MLRSNRIEVLMTQTPQFPDQPVPSADLRSVMGFYLTGVTIVTLTGPDKKPYGLTVTSFNSVSLSPPLILWSLDNRNDKLSLFQNTQGFAVNIMAADQLALCKKFAAADNDRFLNCDWRLARLVSQFLKMPWRTSNAGHGRNMMAVITLSLSARSCR